MQKDNNRDGWSIENRLIKLSMPRLSNFSSETSMLNHMKAFNERRILGPAPNMGRMELKTIRMPTVKIE
ncbi:MAG: hypothetical protein K9L30_15915 [Desulfobacterales bacterium]|nr:hypothetical protein [Desulfobacterales bacterium]